MRSVLLLVNVTLAAWSRDAQVQTLLVDLSMDSMSIETSFTIGQVQLQHHMIYLVEHPHLADAASKQTTWYQFLMNCNLGSVWPQALRWFYRHQELAALQSVFCIASPHVRCASIPSGVWPVPRDCDRMVFRAAVDLYYHGVSLRV